MLSSEQNRCVLAVVLGLGLAVAAAAQVVDERLPVGCGKAHALAQRMAAAEAQQAERAEYEAHVAAGLREALEDTDLLHCALALEILPAQYDNLVGTNTMTVQSKSAALTQFSFRLRTQFVIDSALINGTTPVSVTMLSDTTRVATLDRAYGLDEVFTLAVTYHGHAESRGFGSIEFDTHNGADIVYTLSEPYYAYTWWPVKDGDFGLGGDNGDKFTLDLALTAPETMVTASNGVLQSIDTLAGFRQRYNWSSDYPVATYLVCFSSTNYNTWSLDYVPLAGGTMPVLFYIYPESDTPANRAAWGQVVQMMYTLRDLYGEYPFVNEKYGIYECQFGGGMEHQTFTAQGTFAEWVTVHELSHQWWGDMVTCKTWNDIWLNEGFATYAEGLWAEFKPGSTGLPALKSTMAAKKYTGAGSVYVTDAELGSLYSIFDTNTSYNKGGWVVHMLRHVLGDDDFFAMLAAYRAAHEYGAATTADLQAVCESFYGASLDWFFQEWIYGERAPAYAYGWSTVNVAGQDYLLLYVDQTQSASYQRFTMPIDIVVNGTTYKIFDSADPQHFVIPIPAPATTVQFDPDAWVLWSTVSNTSYVAGPPKIVAMTPAPGDMLPPSPAASTLAVTFHTNVSTAAGNYALVGASTGAQPVGFAYNSATYTATLTTAGPLPPDTYTLTVSDALTAVNSGQHLDGEIADPADPASLPSGNGVAGGAATLSFTVAYPRGDLNCDGVVNFSDINPFVLYLSNFPVWQTTYAGCPAVNGDIDGNGVYPSFGDINPFVTLLSNPG